MKDLTNVFD
jgi:hypothetical protein